MDGAGERYDGIDVLISNGANESSLRPIRASISFSDVTWGRGV
jgi:hypothetical protein